MNRNMLTYVVALSALLVGGASGQVKSLTNSLRNSGDAVEQRHYQFDETFEGIRQAIIQSDMAMLSQHMGSQVSLNLRGGEGGSYSANQAYYVLANYFRTRKLVGLDFTSIGESASTPYAAGVAVFNVKGTRDQAQVYVSLTQSGDRWVIAQINIY